MHRRQEAALLKKVAQKTARTPEPRCSGAGAPDYQSFFASFSKKKRFASA
jgi:hypothetical protein